MTPRDLNRLLDAASAVPVPSRDTLRADSVWAGIARGWDPERIEWQRWLKRWWPWVGVTVLVSAVVVAALPHGAHSEPGTQPPALQLFQKPAASPEVAAQP